MHSPQARSMRHFHVVHSHASQRANCRVVDDRALLRVLLSFTDYSRPFLPCVSQKTRIQVWLYENTDCALRVA